MIGRFGRTARGRAKEAAFLLLLASVIAAPEIAAAKTYPTDPAPYPEGDPTADDQPSPTPKKTASVTSSEAVRVRDSVAIHRLPNGGRMSWGLYLRILSRLILR